MYYYTISTTENLFEKINQEQLLLKEGSTEIMAQGTIQLPDIAYAYGDRNDIPIQRPIGMPNKPPGIPKTIQHPPMTITHIKNAVVLPGGVIISKNKILIDSFASSWDTTYHDYLTKINDSQWAVTNITPQDEIDQPVFFCDYQHSNFYGHFMLDALTRLWGLLYLKNFLGLKKFVTLQTFSQKYIKEYLNLYEFENHDVLTITQPVLVKDLFLATKSIQIQDYCSPAASLCWNPIKQYAPNSNQIRLYISRRTQNKRQLLNEEKIEHFLSKQGYIVIYPETLSVSDQIILFSNASHIIGPSGTNLFGIAFSPLNTKVMVLASNAFVHYSEFFLRYGSTQPIALLTGESEAYTSAKYTGNINAPWSIDESKFTDMASTFGFL